MFKQLALATIVLASTLGMTLSSGSVVAAPSAESTITFGWYKARARMHSDGRMKGAANYKDRNRRRGVEQRLQIEIEKAQRNTRYVVAFNGRRIGSVVTNRFGKGEINFRTEQYIDDPDEWIPLPDDFPMVVDGDVIEVGPASGTFFER